MTRNYNVLLAATLGLAVAGCQNMNNTQSGALLGTGLGATTGAIIGNASGHAGGGALIGAAAGALAGGLVGNAEDAREERDAAVAHAQYEHARSQAVAQAVTDTEVVNMTHNRVSDGVIINALRTRGCRWNSSPENVIALKQQGVSDSVIEAMQNTGLRPAPVGALPPPVVYAPPPPPVVGGGVVVVGPGYYGPRPYWGPRPYGRRPYYRGW
jgi:uncharacterized protein YcfJ